MVSFAFIFLILLTSECNSICIIMSLYCLYLHLLCSVLNMPSSVFLLVLNDC